MNNILKQVSNLYEQELYSNVIYLAELSLSFCNKSQDVTPYMKFQFQMYYADSLFHEHQYLQAEIAYNQALQLRKYIMKSKNNPKDTNNPQKEIIPDVEIKYKLYMCYTKLKQTQKAIEVLQSITARARTPKINMALGNMYKDSGYERSATTCYKEVLRECPSAIEAAENLLKLGVNGTEVNSLMLDTTTELGWVKTWLRGMVHMHSHEYQNALQTFKSIDALKGNTVLLVTLAYCYVFMCNDKKALTILQKAQHSDPNMIYGRDLLAYLLVNNNDKDSQRELEKLVSVDLEMSRWSCEHWIVMGWYMYSIHKFEKAVFFGQQALTMQRKNVEALLLKAHTLMQMEKYHEATLHFKEVTEYTPHRFEGHKGLVDSNIKLNRMREGQTMAMKACKILTNSAPALALYASALMKDPVTFSKARSILDHSLAADPSYMSTIVLLAEYLDREKRHEEACTILLKHIEKYPSSRTHQLLADCYVRLQQDEEAFTHYNAALRLDPHNQRAMEGLNALGRPPSKMDSSYYMSVTGEGSSYTSQEQSVPSDELEESDSDPWQSNNEFMSFD